MFQRYAASIIYLTIFITTVWFFSCTAFTWVLSFNLVSNDPRT